EAFVWVHAQAETNKSLYIKAARMGAWVSLDGITTDYENYADSLTILKKEGFLHRALISHDAGWYRPGEDNGGKITGYTSIFTELLPRLHKRGFTQRDIRRLLVKNPAAALQLRVRKIKE